MIDAKNKIMIIKKWEASKNLGASIWLRASCDCGSELHDLNMWIEWDEDFELVSLRFYNNLNPFDTYNIEYTNSFFNSIKSKLEEIKNFFSRIKKAFNLIFYNHIEVEGEFIFEGSEQIQDFINALQQSLMFVEEQERERLPIIFLKKGDSIQ